MGNLWRLWRIMFVFTRYRLDVLVPLEQLPLKLRILLWLAPWRLNPVGKLSRGARLRLALESLGPIFIKFGQILSTRPDLIPADIIAELHQAAGGGESRRSTTDNDDIEFHGFAFDGLSHCD